MSSIVKSILRPMYRPFLRLPAVRRIIASSAGPVLNDSILWDLIQRDYGAEYGVTRSARAELVDHFKRTCSSIQTGTFPVVHALLAREILSIPRSLSGDVIECGCFKGASTATLSLVCRLVGRRLLVCDSFQGLPDEGEKLHTGVHFGVFGYYKEGMFCGSLDEVKANVARYGDINVCDFVPGFFSDSLPSLSRPLVFGFIDVDLVDSTKDCLRYIWPLLREGGSLFSDDAGDMDVVRVFFDDAWWQNTLHQPAPGFVGAGCGLPLSPEGCSVGYVRKLGQFNESQWKRADHLYYPDSRQPNSTPTIA